MGEIKNIEKFHVFSAVYHGSSVNWKQFAQEGKMEIAFIGRSNVGKSSLTNSICGNRKTGPCKPGTGENTNNQLL